MAYTWLYSTDLSPNESLTSSKTDISKLKANILALKSTFGMDASQLRTSSSASPTGVVKTSDIITIVQDLNVLENGQTCSSYNSTQWSSVCSANYSNDGNRGAQQAGQYSDHSNCSDLGNRSTEYDYESSNHIPD